ncbi:MAG: hypothetical protein ACKOU6_10895 [Planctomycetota bacterium]
MKAAIVHCDAEILKPLQSLLTSGSEAHAFDLVPVESAGSGLLAGSGLAGSGLAGSSPAGTSRSAVDSDERLATLRRYVQDGTTLVVVHPACSAIAALELDMIRRDTQARLLVHVPGARHPALEELAAYVTAGDDSAIGRVEQVVVERRLVERQRSAVLEQFARDAYLLRQIAGRITRVGATAPQAGEAAWGSLGVQMTGDGQMLLRWSVEPGDVSASGRIILIGAKGRVTLEMPSHDPWQLTSTAAASVSRSYPREEVDRVVGNKLKQDLSAATSDWPGVCRDLDVADLVEQSLRRGRMLELHHETVTEEDTFKGVMSAIGCLLLLLVPLVLIVAVVVDGFVHGWHSQMDYNPQGASGPVAQPASGSGRLWLILILFPLLLFLLLQTLQMVFRSGGKQPTDASRS